MRYYTKDWYIKAKAAGACMGLEICSDEEAASREYYEKLFALLIDDIRSECEQFANIPFEKFAEERTESEAFLREEFERRRKENDPEDAEFIAAHRLSSAIENLRLVIPKEILLEVPDIRILALHRTTKRIFYKIENYSDICRSDVMEINFRFEEEYSYQTEDIPDEIWQEYGYAGGHIKKIITKDDSVDIMIDNYGSGSDVTALHLGGCTEISLDGGLEGAEWIMNEIYLNDGIYTLCALCRNGGVFPGFTIKAAEVSFDYDR